MTFLVSEGFDAEYAAEHVELDILGLPEPMRYYQLIT